MNKVINSLSSLGAPLSKEEYFECALGELDEEFSAFITMINGRMHHMTVSEFESQLLAQEEVNDRCRKVDLTMAHENLVHKESDARKEGGEYTTPDSYENYIRDSYRG
ncbi:hypothetical protein AHAS_Ahas18G0223700 [Arachis hypogaea]